MTKVKIHIDNFLVEENQITAYTIVDGNDIDFTFSKGEFETWGDDNDMRTWEEPIPSWEEIYSGWEMMARFLELYIQFIYDQEELDIVTPIKKICAKGLDESLSTLSRLQTEFSPIKKTVNA